MGRTTGIVRKLDDLGRFSLPKEIRDQFGLLPKGELEILVEGNEIILRKPSTVCCFCGAASPDLYQFHGRGICSQCVKELRNKDRKLNRAPSK